MFVIVAVVALFMYVPSMARQEVQDKAFQQWTEKDVTKLLNDSAWARTQAIRVTRRRQVRSVAGQVGVEALGTTPTAADSKASLGSAEDAVDYRFTMRLRSALPIRQAIVRLVQLQSNYDQMQPAQKKSLDAQMRQLLECEECRDNYIVSVGFGSTNSHGVDLIYDWFRGQTIESLKGYIYLANDRGGRRELSGFIPPKVQGDEAFFFFARNDKEGKPLVTVDDKRVLFRMSDKNASSVTNFSLDVSKLVINGKVEL
jgi:hypothetical protein